MLRGPAVVDELGLDQNAVVGNSGDKAQHGIGADQVRGLADAGPGSLRVTDKVQRIRSGRSGDAVQTVGVQKAIGPDMIDHFPLADRDGDLGEGDVAGIGQGPAKVVGIMRKRTVKKNAGDFLLTQAEETALPDGGNALDGCSRSDQLEDGTGGKGCGEQAVDVNALRCDRIALNGVDGRGGNHADQFAGAIVHDADSAFAAGESGIGLVVED